MSEPTYTGLTDSGTGGDDMLYDLNQPFDKGDMAWVATAGCLVFIMIVPGVGLLYSGVARKKHALSLIWASVMACCLIVFQWFFWGWSLTFSHDVKSGMIGSLEFFGMMNTLGAPSAGASTLPDILFCFYQMMFAMITGALMLGGACERARLGPMMVFLFLWMTLVYNFVACWTWNAEGWLAKLGALDFAGGGPVHQSSGISALAYALILGKRNDPTVTHLPKYKPHSVTNIVLGTIFLWFGWLGFNGGSGGSSSIRAWYACMNTMLAAACGGLAWLFVDYFREGRRWTTAGMCMGVIAGLVGITPAAGFVPIYFAVPIGVICAIACNYAVDIKEYLKIDDGMDVFSLHAVGGFVGSCLTGLFAADYVAASDGSVANGGSPIDGGWLNHHYKQLGYQLAACTSILLWSFCMTSIILLVMDKIPFLKLRLSEDEEELGTDAAQIGEFIYEDDQIYIPEPVRSIKSRASQPPPVEDETASEPVEEKPAQV
ncbi:ammonium permease [Saccharomycopsis crataegensis]|uniref:Ammonium transporter n=1 Tax=Saccharomycopsis crataegensis TaxID=43959 RepID=A0AAV5QJW0_9ASCO|nr:ammonium permease [Saccharomycopsis crataegensis]